MSLNLLVIVLAFICFVLAALGVSSKVNLVALGLALFMLSMFVR